MANPILQIPRFVVAVLFPGLLMSAAASVFFVTALLSPQLLLTLQIHALREKSFAKFWSFVGPQIAKDFPQELGKIIDQHCRGIVLDIGPGSGFQVKRFQSAFDDGQIEHIYGVEPSTDMHEQLTKETVDVFGKRAAEKYTILTSGAQPSQLYPALKSAELSSTAQFDTIVCLRAMCGIPEPTKTADMFYELLKPGGTLVYLEHVRARKPAWRMWQHFYELLGWRLWNGGCELTRDTLGAFKDAGGDGWKQVVVHDPAEKLLIPEIYGYMIKK